jgi:peptide/nickel transport system substrate-binding protein
MNSHHKLWSLLLLTVTIAMVVAGCAAPTPEVVTEEVEVTREVETEVEVEVTREVEVETEVEVAADPQPGGTLTIASYSEPDGFDPHVEYSRHSWLVNWQIMDTLVVMDSEKNLHPGLANNWDVSDDGSSFTFYLRDDVTFHDGTPFNAEAVKANFDRIMDPETGSMMAVDKMPTFESAEVIDEYTVKINFSEPNGTFLVLAANSLYMVSPTAAEEWGADFTFNPVGTGPFKFVEWVPQSHVKLERNEDYNWAPQGLYDHEGPAYLDEVIFRYIPEEATRTAALETGEAHIAIRIGALDVPMFEEDPNFYVIKEMVPGLPTNYMLNTAKPPTDDVRVRRAMNLWFDRELANEVIWYGERGPAYGPLAPNTLGYLPEVEELNALDRERALELLAEAGWEDTDGDGILDKDGENFRLEIYSCGDYVEPVDAVYGQFEEMGAETNTTMVPWSEQKKVVYEGDPSMMVATFNNVDPNVMRLLFHSENIGENGWNWTHLDEGDPELQAQIDELLEQGDQVSNPAQREEIYQEVQRLLVENGVNLPLFVDYYIYGVNGAVKGWNIEPGGWPLTHDLWLAE